MLARPARIALYTAIAALLLLILGGLASNLYTEALWFDGLGYASVLWTRIATSLVVRAITAAIGATIVAANLWFVVRGLGPVQVRRRYGNLEIAEQVPRRYVSFGVAAISVLAGWWLSSLVFGGGASMAVLAWWRSVPWGITDPHFQRDVSFFVFSLPVLSRLIEYLLLVIGWSLLLAFIGYVLVGAVRWRENRVETDEAPRLHFALGIAAVILVLAARYWIGRYGILLEGTGFSGGVGYTDIHARLPARRVLAVLSVAASGALVFGAVRRTWWPPVVAVGVLLFAAIGLGYAYPAVIQRLRVEPNELARERPYIVWNIEFTRRAYGLAEVERSGYNPSGTLGGWEANAAAIQRLPLWDPSPLRENFNQTQTVREYLRFPGVHFDRYGAPGQERQVAIAVREFNRGGLENQTWTTLHLDPTVVRGWGAVAVNASAKNLGDNKPAYWLHEMNPILLELDAPRGLALTEPSVFFGVSPQEYLVIGAALEDTLDMDTIPTVGPAGPAAVGAGSDAAELSVRSGGVPLNSFLKRVAFAWRFSDYNLLFAGEITDASRVLFRRSVMERVQQIAPFAVWDSTPHPVIADGRIVWIVDGYTVTSNFPVARAEQLGPWGPFRYINNALKATVDAVTGSVVLYTVDPEDPILLTYARIFPSLMRPLSEMPQELRSHLLVPPLYFQVQARVLQEYHVESPDLFFSGEDMWQIPADGAAVPGTAPYQPLPLFTPVPGESGVAFMTVMPFNARQRQNMTALLLVRNDADRYGEKLLLEFPAERQVRGPAQIQALIEQEPSISRDLSLWRQEGSDVEFGRLRIVPLDSAVLYVQPVYLSFDTNAIPQLEYVVASDGSDVNMAVTLPAAIDGLYASGAAQLPNVTIDPEFPLPVSVPDGWAGRAVELMRMADDALRAGDWAGFGRRWSELQDLLRRAAQDSIR